MKQKRSFLRSVCALAIPVALQSMLQASFSVVDQVMIGQLGEANVAGVGLAGKFTSIYSVMVSAIAAVAGIMISQYLGQRNSREVKRSFFVNLFFSLGLAGLFSLLCLLLPEQIMELYTKDARIQTAAAEYLVIIAGTFLPIAGASLLSTQLRCLEKASLPLYAGIAAAVLNTGLNYILIFGKLGFAPMGARGAAIATLISQLANFLVILLLYLLQQRRNTASVVYPKERFNWKQYGKMLLPILVCEFLWSLGENVYAAIYGHLGTDACAAMTLINPVQSLTIGALCGLSQAAGVIVGKRLGNEAYEDAYDAGKKLMYYGLIGSAIFSVIILCIRPWYVGLYQVEPIVKALTKQILVAYALIAPVKVLNMILGGGVVRSGGRTQYIMFIDIIGTWGVGVPLGLLSAFVFGLSIPYVYFILSLEECVRFAITLAVFRKRHWMQKLDS